MHTNDLIAALVLITFFLVYIVSMILRFTLSDFPSDVRYLEPYELKTGDILCISYNNPASFFVGSFTRSAWIHTAMVWVDPVTNIRYLLEGAICRQKTYKHFYKIPILTWMNLNRSNVMGYKAYNGPPIDPHKMMEKFEPFIKNVKLEGFRYTWFRFLFNDPYDRTVNYDRKYTCFEVTIILGQECGIFEKTKKYSSYFPSHVVNDLVEMPEGTFYSKVVQCKQNPIETKIHLIDRKRFEEYWKVSYSK